MPHLKLLENARTETDIEYWGWKIFDQASEPRANS